MGQRRGKTSLTQRPRVRNNARPDVSARRVDPWGSRSREVQLVRTHATRQATDDAGNTTTRRSRPQVYSSTWGMLLTLGDR